MPLGAPDIGSRVLSVNVGAIREIEWRGRLETTAIWKHPVQAASRSEG